MEVIVFTGADSFTVEGATDIVIKGAGEFEIRKAGDVVQLKPVDSNEG